MAKIQIDAMEKVFELKDKIVKDGKDGKINTFRLTDLLLIAFTAGELSAYDNIELYRESMQKQLNDKVERFIESIENKD